MNAVANADRGEDFITVSWDASKAVTKLTVSDGTEEEGQEPRTIELDDEAKAAGRYTITPSTSITMTQSVVLLQQALQLQCLLVTRR